LQSRRRVLVHGLAYFGEIFSEFMSGDGWEFVYYPDRGLTNLVAMSNALRRCDLVYQIGGRVTIGKFLGAAKLFRKNRIVMHWVGSDSLQAKSAVSLGKRDPWVLNSIHHWADSTWILDEVRNLGVGCAYVPLPSPRIPDKLEALPAEFTVLVYVPSVKCAELYGLDLIQEAAKALPDVRFELVGLRDGPLKSHPGNIRVHPRIPDLTDFYRKSTIVWRPTRHDGLSWTVCEALGHGRHVLWSYPFPGCTLVRSASAAVSEIRKLQGLHATRELQVNREGASFISKSNFCPATFRRNIRCHLEKILTSAE
jgi:hypothetical protein